VRVAAQNFLDPGISWPAALASVVLLGVLTLWPLVEAAIRQRWGWFWATIFLGPIAGVGWFAFGRRQPTSV
jgi:hypothetical protein